MKSARILGRGLAACAGLALALALPARAGMNDPHMLVVRGVVRTATGSPLAGARVIAKGDYNTEATTDDRGRYTLSVPLGSAASLRRSRYALEFRAEQGGKRLALSGGIPALAIELSLVSGSTRVRVRSNMQDATTAMAAALSQDGATTAWVEANFDAATRPTGAVELRVVDEVDVAVRGSARGLPVIPTPDVTAPAREGARPTPVPGASARASRPDTLARPRPQRAESAGAESVATGRSLPARQQPPAAAPASGAAAREDVVRTSAGERRIGARGEPLDDASAVAAQRPAMTQAPKAAASAAGEPATPKLPFTGTPAGEPATPKLPAASVTTAPPSATPPSVPSPSATPPSVSPQGSTFATRPASHVSPVPNPSAGPAGAAVPATAVAPGQTPAVPATPSVAMADSAPPATTPSTPAPAAVKAATPAPVPAQVAPPPSESGPPPPKPITSFTSSPASILDTCACRVYGTVEIDWDRPLERNFVVGLTLVGPATQEGEVELFMGTPREFRLGPLPCGDYRLLVKPHGRVRYALRRGGSEVRIHCTGFTQVPVVLVPKR